MNGRSHMAELAEGEIISPARALRSATPPTGWTFIGSSPGHRVCVRRPDGGLPQHASASLTAQEIRSSVSNGHRISCRGCLAKAARATVCSLGTLEPLERATWQEFETLVEKLTRSFHPKCVVTRNDHIFGKNSQRERQIDVSIRHKEGIFDLLIVVECKRYDANVGMVENGGLRE